MKTLINGDTDSLAVLQTNSTWPAILISSIAIFLVSLNTTMLYAVFKNIQIAFPQKSLADLSWVINAYTVVYASMLIPAGNISNRFGRKATFSYGSAIFITASMFCGLSESANELIAARVAQALGAALLSSSSLALVLALFPAQEKIFAINIWGVVAGLGAAIGPCIGSFVADSYGWNWAFYMNIPLGLITILLGQILIEESITSDRAQKPDFVGMSLLIAGVICTSLSLLHIKSENWSRSELITTLCFGLMIMGTFCIWLKTIDQPLVEPKLFENSRFAQASLATLLFGSVFPMMFFGFFFFLFDVLHYGLPKIGLAVSIGLLFVVSFVLMTRKYGSGLNDKAFISTGAILFVVGGLWFTCDITDKLNYFTNWIPGLLILGVGMGLLISSIDRAITNRAHASQHAITIQIIQATSQIGTVIGVSVATLILGENFSSIEQFQTIYAICASLMLCAALLLLV